MSEKTDRRLKFGRIKMAIAIGVGLALVPAALFAATTTRPIDGIAGIVREQAASPTATAKAAATTAPTAAATAKAAATTAAAAPAAPKSGTGGFLGQDAGSSNTMTIILLVAAAASVAVAGRMVTRRR